jgi:predicted DCC family thiol-disulfide oxidoreductase YuxK
MEQEPMTVVYNDTCPICAREVAGYRRMVARHGLDVAFSGLSDGGYARFGLSKRDAARRFHVVQGGTLTSGIPAFVLLWQRIPRLRWLARAVQLPVMAPLSALIYDHALAPALFAMHRRRERQGRARHIA